MENVLRNDWAEILQSEFEKPYFQELSRFLEKEYETETIYPARENIFNALHLTSFQDTKVVILGQDPYHGPNQAHGLSFSVQPEVTPPPSVRNIYKELQSDLGCEIPNNGYLIKWAEQGVLLLNTVLTVRAGKPYSHKGKGWETFTDEVIRTLNGHEKPVVFILWGKKAQAKEDLITASHHYIIQSPHPSPFSAKRGFFGSKPFSKANQFLEKTGSEPIDWQIPDI